MRISGCCVLLTFLLQYPGPSRCIDLNFDGFSIGQLFDTVQNFFASPFLKTIRESWGASIDEECQFKCSNGRDPRPNFRHVPKSNGCGVPGLQVKIPKYLAGPLEECCSNHDICYGTCNADKNECDRKFKKCLYGICKKFEDYISEDLLKGCKSVAKTMYIAVMTMGCKYYIDAQKEACVCSGEYHYSNYDL